MDATSNTASQTLLILGASGDLTARLLLPGLGALLSSGKLNDLHLIGSDVKDWNTSRWRAQVAESFEQADAGGGSVDTVLNTTTYLQADVTTPDDWRALLEACQGQIFIYFALPPAISVTACQVLKLLGCRMTPG